MYLDKYGLITQRDGDGGDKLQRTGFWFETGAPPLVGMADYPTALHILTPLGGFIRDEIKYMEPTDVSRDQLVSNIRACGVYGFTGFLKSLLWCIIRNFSRYPNNDIAFMTDYAGFIRAFKAYWLYPVLWILDIWLVLGSVWMVLRSHYDAQDLYAGEDLNHIGFLNQAMDGMATAWTWLARKIFKLRKGGPMYGLQVYFRPETGANPEFISLWAQKVAKF